MDWASVITAMTSVALRKESVDRNYGDDLTFADGVVSLSARRAWIEINMSYNAAKLWVVALRKESVDRNRNSQYSYFLFYGVALRKESVDRNRRASKCPIA